jgi:hypothetical protein
MSLLQRVGFTNTALLDEGTALSLGCFCWSENEMA